MPHPLTRALHLLAVRKDAAALAAVESAGGRRVYTFRASDGDFDRYQDRLSVKGWRVDAYNLNGVVLYNHDDGALSAQTGAQPPLPIGKGRVYVQNDALMVDVEFDDEDDFAKRVERKVAKGILNAVSVRYLMLPGQYRQNDRGGFDCDAQELLEVSVVTIPGNARALRARSLEEGGDDLIERIAQRVVELLEERDGKGDEPSTEPAADPEAAPPEQKAKPDDGEPPQDDKPHPDDAPPTAPGSEDDKEKSFNAADAAKGFVDAFRQYVNGSERE